MGFLTPEKTVVGSGPGDGKPIGPVGGVTSLQRSGLPDDVVAFFRDTIEMYGEDTRFVVFTPGSLNPPNATKFFREASSAVRRMNANAKARGAHRIGALFLTKYESVLPPDLFPTSNTAATEEDAKRRSIAHFSFVSLSALLPFCHLCVHHGGIGTIGSCLSTATPSIIVPSAFDQFDNAEIIETLGVGLTIHEKDLSSDSLISAIRRLIDVGSSATEKSASNAPVASRGPVRCGGHGNNKVAIARTGDGGKQAPASEWELVRSRCDVLAADIGATSVSDNIGNVANAVAEFLTTGRVSGPSPHAALPSALHAT